MTIRALLSVLMVAVLAGCGAGEGADGTSDSSDAGDGKNLSVTIQNNDPRNGWGVYYVSAAQIIDGVLQAPEAAFGAEGQAPLAHGEKVTLRLRGGLYRFVVDWGVSDVDDFELFLVGGSWLLGVRRGVHSLNPL